MHLIYDISKANKCGIKEHPVAVMRNLGISWTSNQCVPVAGCWLFNVDDNLDVSNLPEYVRLPQYIRKGKLK